MIKSGADQLNKERIRQLLAAVGTKPHEDASADMDAVDYDWRKPRYFNLEQCEKVQCFAETAVQECVQEFSRLYQSACDVSLITAEQTFLSESCVNPQEEGYYVPFGTGPQASFGFLFIPNRSAFIWTGQVLGSSDAAENAERKLSKLEESFLMDIAADLTKAFSRVYGKDLVTAPVVSDPSLIDLKGSQELYIITFEAAMEKAETVATRGSFVICCDKLDSVAGKMPSIQPKVSEGQIASVILEHVHRIPVSVHVELGRVMIPFKDVLGLQANDIVLLDKKVTDTIDVLVEDRLLFQGRPVQSMENYAVLIR